MNNEKLFIYLISQEVNNGYETYGSAVVIAESEEAAKLIHPSGWWQLNNLQPGEKPWYEKTSKTSGDWTLPEFVEVSLVGEAREGSFTGSVVCSSYSAG